MNAPFEHPFKSRHGARARRRDTPPYRRKILFEALEQRLLLSADGASSTIADELAAALLQAEAPPPAAQAPETEAGAQATIAPEAWAESDPTAASWIIEVEPGVRALQAGDADNVWRITGADEGTLNGVPFSDIAVLLGGTDNQDTFYLEPGGSLSGYLEGGAGGFDTLVIAGGSFTETSYIATGPQSGVVTLDGKQIHYFGLEPVANTGTAVNAVYDLTAGADQFTVQSG